MPCEHTGLRQRYLGVGSGRLAKVQDAGVRPQLRSLAAQWCTSVFLYELWSDNLLCDLNLEYGVLRDISRAMVGMKPLLLGYAASPSTAEGASCSFAVLPLPDGAQSLDTWLHDREIELLEGMQGHQRAAAAANGRRESASSHGVSRAQTQADLDRVVGILSERVTVAKQVADSVMEAQNLGRWFCDWKLSQWSVIPSKPGSSRAQGDGVEPETGSDDVVAVLTDVDALEPMSSDCGLPSTCHSPLNCLDRATPTLRGLFETGFIAFQSGTCADAAGRNLSCSKRDVNANVEAAGLLDIVGRILLGP